MKKIPIRQTIVAAYKFAFGDLGTVIGLTWLPLVIYTLGRFFVMNYVQGLTQSGDPSSGGEAIIMLFGFSLVSLFLTAIIGVSLTRQVMSPREGKIVAQFMIGPTEFNYFLALLAIFVIMIAAYVAAFIVDLMVAGMKDALAGAMHGTMIGRSVGVIATIALIVLLDLAILAYVGVRLAFMVAPVTVVEGKIDLIRSWQLTRGNFWRLIAILVVTMGPIFIVGEIAFAAIVGPGYVAAFGQALVSIFDAIAVGAPPPTQALEKLPDIASKTPWLLGLSFLLAPFSYGLLFAGPAFAYRALNGGLPPAKTPDMGPFRPA